MRVFLGVCVIFGLISGAWARDPDGMDPIDQAFTTSVVEDVTRTLPSIAQATAAPEVHCASGGQNATNTPQSDPSQGDFGRLANRFIIFLGYQPQVSSEKFIENAVGRPDELNPETKIKTDALGPQLTFQLLSESLDRAGQRVPIPDEPEKLGYDKLFQYWTPRDHLQVRSSLFNTAINQFNGDERLDLEVYGLTRAGALPIQAWNGFKDFVVNNDGYVMMAVLAEQAAANQGDIRTSGYFYEKSLDDDGRENPAGEKKYRVGWFMRAKDVGFAMHPDVVSGLAVATPGIEAALGLSHRVAAQPGEERNGLDVSVTGHRFPGFFRAWEAEGKVWYHQSLSADTPGLPGSRTLAAQAYARRPTLFDNPNLTLLVSAGVTRDLMQGVTNANASIGVADSKGIGAMLRLRDNEDPVTHLHDRYVGIALGGDFKWRDVMKLLGRD